MADLFAEVDEAMRRERLEKIWKQHHKLIIGVIAAIILATGVKSGFESWNNAVRADQTDALITMLEDSGFPDNVPGHVEKLRPGLRGVALLTAAGALMDAGKDEDALAMYTRAADDGAIPPDLRDLAVLMRVRMLAQKADADVPALLAQLNPLIADGHSPWRWHARLESTALRADRQGDFAGARDLLKEITDAVGLPDTLTAKAVALDHIYAVRQRETAPAQAPEEGTGDKETKKKEGSDS